MLIDPTQALRNAPTAARAQRTASGAPAADLPAMPAEAQPWLAEAARAIGQAGNAAAYFANTGLLSLDAVNVLIFCQQATPPRWTVLGYVKQPAGVQTSLWSEALLRANNVAMAIDSCAFCTDAQGTAVLLKQIPTYHYGDVQALAEALETLDELAAGLRVTVHAAATIPTEAAESPLPDTPPLSPELARLKDSMDALVEREMNVVWHRPFIEQALRTLDLPVPQQAIGNAGAFKVGGRLVEVIASPDNRHLLLTTSVSMPLDTLAQRQAALGSNLLLMTTAHCSLALTPTGASLQSRWDATDQDGTALAGWLDEFVSFAIAFDTRQRP